MLVHLFDEEVLGAGKGEDVMIGTGRGHCGIMADTARGLSVQLLAVQPLSSQIQNELHELRSDTPIGRQSFNAEGFLVFYWLRLMQTSEELPCKNQG